jgi:hypothetical protein
MGCLFILLAAAAPRVTLVLMWIFGNMVDRAFSSDFLVPALGIVALPYTTLFYVFAWEPGGASGWGLVAVLMGALLDIANLAGAGFKARRRATAY